MVVKARHGGLRPGPNLNRNLQLDPEEMARTGSGNATMRLGLNLWNTFDNMTTHDDYCKLSKSHKRVENFNKYVTDIVPKILRQYVFDEFMYPFEFRDDAQQKELFQAIMGVGKYTPEEDRGALRGMNMLLRVTPRDMQAKEGATKLAALMSNPDRQRKLSAHVLRDPNSFVLGFGVQIMRFSQLPAFPDCDMAGEDHYNNVRRHLCLMNDATTIHGQYSTIYWKNNAHTTIEEIVDTLRVPIWDGKMESLESQGEN